MMTSWAKNAISAFYPEGRPPTSGNTSADGATQTDCSETRDTGGGSMTDDSATGTDTRDTGTNDASTDDGDDFSEPSDQRYSKSTKSTPVGGKTAARYSPSSPYDYTNETCDSSYQQGSSGSGTDEDDGVSDDISDLSVSVQLSVHEPLSPPKTQKGNKSRVPAVKAQGFLFKNKKKDSISKSQDKERMGSLEIQSKRLSVTNEPSVSSSDVSAEGNKSNSATSVSDGLPDRVEGQLVEKDKEALSQLKKHLLKLGFRATHVLTGDEDNASSHDRLSSNNERTITHDNKFESSAEDQPEDELMAERTSKNQLHSQEEHPDDELIPKRTATRAGRAIVSLAPDEESHVSSVILNPGTPGRLAGLVGSSVVAAKSASSDKLCAKGVDDAGVAVYTVSGRDSRGTHRGVRTIMETQVLEVGEATEVQLSGAWRSVPSGSSVASQLSKAGVSVSSQVSKAGTSVASQVSKAGASETDAPGKSASDAADPESSASVASQKSKASASVASRVSKTEFTPPQEPESPPPSSPKRQQHDESLLKSRAADSPSDGKQPTDSSMACKETSLVEANSDQRREIESTTASNESLEDKVNCDEVESIAEPRELFADTGKDASEYGAESDECNSVSSQPHTNLVSANKKPFSDILSPERMIVFSRQPSDAEHGDKENIELVIHTDIGSTVLPKGASPTSPDLEDTDSSQGAPSKSGIDMISHIFAEEASKASNGEQVNNQELVLSTRYHEIIKSSSKGMKKQTVASPTSCGESTKSGGSTASRPGQATESISSGPSSSSPAESQRIVEQSSVVASAARSLCSKDEILMYRPDDENALVDPKDIRIWEYSDPEDTAVSERERSPRNDLEHPATSALGSSRGVGYEESSADIDGEGGAVSTCRSDEEMALTEVQIDDDMEEDVLSSTNQCNGLIDTPMEQVAAVVDLVAQNLGFQESNNDSKSTAVESDAKAEACAVEDLPKELEDGEVNSRSATADDHDSQNARSIQPGDYDARGPKEKATRQAPQRLRLLLAIVCVVLAVIVVWICLGFRQGNDKYQDSIQVAVDSTAGVAPTKPAIASSSRPTFSPVSAPVPEPKNPTSSAPTFQTFAATISPTISPLPADNLDSGRESGFNEDMCEDWVTTDARCYPDFSALFLSFQNCDPLGDDWIGIYPANSDPQSLGRPSAWVWTCGSQDCFEEVFSSAFPISHDLPPGYYRAHLARDKEDLPYTSYASSQEFLVVEAGVDCQQQ